MTRKNHIYSRKAVDNPLAWVFWCLVSFCCGVAVYFLLPVEPHVVIYLRAALLLIAASFLLSRFLRGRWNYMPITISLCVFSLLLGMYHAQWSANMAARDYIHIPVDGETVWVRGIIGGMKDKEYGTQLTLRDISLWRPEVGRFAVWETPRKIRVNVRTKIAPGVTYGSVVKMRAVLSPPPAHPPYTGGYDFFFGAFFGELGAVGYAVTDVEEFDGTLRPAHNVTAMQAVRDKTLDSINRARREMHMQLTSGGSSASGVASALLTGIRGAIPQNVLEDMRASGLGHLLAISGLHMALIMGSVYMVMRRIVGFIPPLRLAGQSFNIAANAHIYAAIFALTFGAYYLALSGFAVSARRAYIMMSLMFVGLLLRRSPLLMYPVIIAMTVILVLAPYEVTNAGFAMSFAAVIALIGGYNIITEYRERVPFIRSGEDDEPAKEGRGAKIARAAMLLIAGVAMTSVIAGLATFPFAVYNFGRYAPLGLLGNILAMPIFTVVTMPCALMVLVLPDMLETPFLWVMESSLHIIIYIADFVTRLSSGGGALPKPPLWLMLVIVISGGVAFMSQVRWRTWVLIPFLAGNLMLHFVKPDLPHIIIHEEGRVIAMNDGGKLALSTNRAEKYSTDSWRKLLGHDAFSDGLLSGEGGRYCVTRYCVALGETDIKISRDGADMLVISKSDLRTRGTMVLYGEDQVRFVQDGRILRPWGRAADNITRE